MSRSIALTTAALAAALVAGTAQAQSVTYVADLDHTTVTWEIQHSRTSTNRGRLSVKDGTVTIDRAAKTGKLAFTIDMGSSSVSVPEFGNTLKGPMVFNVAAFPSAKFEADKFSFDGDKVSEVSGTLTLLGKSNPVTLKASNFNCYTHFQKKVEVCGGDFEGTLTRSLFGITFLLPQVAPDNVRLLVQVEAFKQP